MLACQPATGAVPGCRPLGVCTVCTMVSRSMGVVSRSNSASSDSISATQLSVVVPGATADAADGGGCEKSSRSGCAAGVGWGIGWWRACVRVPCITVWALAGTNIHAGGRSDGRGSLRRPRGLRGRRWLRGWRRELRQVVVVVVLLATVLGFDVDKVLLLKVVRRLAYPRVALRLRSARLELEDRGGGATAAKAATRPRIKVRVGQRAGS